MPRFAMLVAAARAAAAVAITPCHCRLTFQHHNGNTTPMLPCRRMLIGLAAFCFHAAAALPFAIDAAAALIFTLDTLDAYA